MINEDVERDTTGSFLTIADNPCSISKIAVSIIAMKHMLCNICWSNDNLRDLES